MALVQVLCAVERVIETLDSWSDSPEDDLLGVRNFGRKSLDELRERLAVHGLLEHSRLGEESSAAGEGEGEESGAGSAEGRGGDAFIYSPDT